MKTSKNQYDTGRRKGAASTGNYELIRANAKWGHSFPGLRILDPLLMPPSTLAVGSPDFSPTQILFCLLV